MKNTVLRALICTLAVLLAMSSAVFAILPAAAAEDTVYLGDRQDLFIARDSLDDFGWNTAHSGEPITIGTKNTTRASASIASPTVMPTWSSTSPLWG